MVDNSYNFIYTLESEVKLRVGMAEGLVAFVLFFSCVVLSYFFCSHNRKFHSTFHFDLKSCTYYLSNFLIVILTRVTFTHVNK